MHPSPNNKLLLHNQY